MPSEWALEQAREIPNLERTAIAEALDAARVEGCRIGLSVAGKVALISDDIPRENNPLAQYADTLVRVIGSADPERVVANFEKKK